MTGKIFLSYRREDAAGFAQALFGQLEQSFPAESLFMDVDRIGAGQDFVRVIEEQVRACDAMLVLIGPNWLTVKDENGQQRLENSEDFVRVEVESALKFDKRVIPVLVQKTEMPRADALPVPLKALSRRNALGLTQERFKSDAHGLIKALEDALAEVEDARRQAETVATAAEARRAAEEATRIEAAARAEKERARLKAIAGLSPEQIAKAEELVNWDFIKDGESSEEFRDHLARFPDGLMKRQVRARLESLVWAGLRQPVDAEALKGFLKEFPEGTRAREANAKLAEFEAQAEAAREAAEREKREMGAWASASADGAVEALEDFQRDWHRSKYADAARKRISEIKGAPWRRWLLLGVGVIAAAAAFLEFQPGSWPPPYDESARTFAEPTGSVDSVAFSPDGRTALSGGYALKLWEVATGKDVRSFSGGDTRSVAFSPDGRTALSGGYHTLILWDVATGKELRSFSGGIPVRSRFRRMAEPRCRAATIPSVSGTSRREKRSECSPGMTLGSIRSRSRPTA
jgi:TIR domain/WD domain, G-beta repeat